MNKPVSANSIKNAALEIVPEYNASAAIYTGEY